MLSKTPLVFYPYLSTLIDTSDKSVISAILDYPNGVRCQFKFQVGPRLAIYQTGHQKEIYVR